MRKPTIILLTGFLGSGKTSLLLSLIEYITKNEKKCAIIENEIGDIGIDNRQARKMGYEVFDLFGGCVCCTIKVTLEATLYHLEENYDLDYILFEPSGMADPAPMYEGLLDVGYTAETIKNIFILDPFRTEMYLGKLDNLFNHSLLHANFVVINKIDIAEAALIQEANTLIEESHLKFNIFKLNLTENLPDSFLKAVFQH